MGRVPALVPDGKRFISSSNARDTVQSTRAHSMSKDWNSYGNQLHASRQTLVTRKFPLVDDRVQCPSIVTVKLKAKHLALVRVNVINVMHLFQFNMIHFLTNQNVESVYCTIQSNKSLLMFN